MDGQKGEEWHNPYLFFYVEVLYIELEYNYFLEVGLLHNDCKILGYEPDLVGHKVRLHRELSFRSCEFYKLSPVV